MVIQMAACRTARPTQHNTPASIRQEIQMDDYTPEEIEFARQYAREQMQDAEPDLETQYGLAQEAG